MGIVEIIGKNRKWFSLKKSLPAFRWNGLELSDDEINKMCQKDMWQFYKKHGVDFRSPAKEKLS